MADIVISEEKVQDLAEAIGEEGSLASVRAGLTRHRFNPETGGNEEITPESQASPGKEADGTGAEQASSEEGSGEPEGGEPKEEPGKPRSKFKSLEVAEKAHAESEKKMHEATAQSARDREAREQVEKERDELKAKLEEAMSARPEEKPEGDADAKPVSREERRAQILQVTTAANVKAIAKIADLDREDPDYQKQVGEAWAEAHTEAMLEAGLAGASQAEIDRMVAASLKAEKEREKAAKAEEAKTQEEAAAARAWQEAFDLAAKSGLDMAEGSVDHDLFVLVSEKYLPKQEFYQDKKNPPTMKKMVEWVVKEVRTRLGRKIDQTDEERARARAHQAQNTPLLKGSNTRPFEDDQMTTPTSLKDIRAQVVDARRTRHKGV